MRYNICNNIIVSQERISGVPGLIKLKQNRGGGLAKFILIEYNSKNNY